MSKLESSAGRNTFTDITAFYESAHVHVRETTLNNTHLLVECEGRMELTFAEEKYRETTSGTTRSIFEGEIAFQATTD